MVSYPRQFGRELNILTDFKLEKIYITDLDGTLLANDGQISEYSRSKLNELISDGAKITVASARNYASIKKLLTGVALPLPVIEVNGAFVTDFATGEHLVINSIPRPIAAEICSCCENNGCVPFVAAFDGKEDHLFYETVTNAGMEWFIADKSEDHSQRLKQRKITSQVLDMQIVCFVIIGEEDIVRDINRQITEKFSDELDSYFFANPYNPQWQWLTIHDKTASKFNAVTFIVDTLGFDYSRLVVFGDSDNDISMMRLNILRATSVAVENATEEVKTLSSEICGNNDNDGVVRYIADDFYRNRRV